MNIILPSLFGLHCILGPADVLPNMNLVESLADHANINIWSMVPSLVDELGETPDVLAKFKSAKFICASGGMCFPLVKSPCNWGTKFRDSRSRQSNKCRQSERRGQSPKFDRYNRRPVYRQPCG